MKYAFSVCLLLICGLTSTQAAEPLLQVSEAWGRAMPPTMTVTALYMQLHNVSSESVVIEKASSPACAVVQFHQTFEQDNISRMRPLDSLIVPAQDTLLLQPNGAHVMCMQATVPLNAETVIELTLQLAGGQSQTVSVPLLTPDAALTRP